MQMREYARDEGASEMSAVRMIAVDMDGTLLATGGLVSAANRAAIGAAERAGIEFVVATGRRHCYAMRQLRALELREANLLVSSNGAVVRTIGSTLIRRELMTLESAQRLFCHLGEFRNALVVTFDCVGPDGEDERGALVVEELAHLHASIDKWMIANEPYIAHIRPLERCLERGQPIQMMLCGTVERMRRAEALLRSLDGVYFADGKGLTPEAGVEIALHRTEYPESDLSIVDILPAGASKGVALRRLAEERGIALSEVMAIGDNWNDLSMLEVAGVPVLMGNAPAELLAMARERGWRVTGTNNEDGVATAIRSSLPEGNQVAETVEVAVGDAV